MKAGHIPSALGVAVRRLRAWWVVLAIALLCLVLAAGGDEVRELGRYEREGLANGEYWRLLSAHLVHLGFGHLWPNVTALLIIAALFDGTFVNRDYVRTGLAASAAIDAGLYVIDPSVLWYVGLSGVLHGFVAAGAFALLMQRQALGAVLAIALCAKLIFEQIAGPLPLTADAVGGPVVVASHLYGAAGGFLAETAAHIVRRRRSRV